MALWLLALFPDDFLFHKFIKVEDGTVRANSSWVTVVVQNRGVSVLLVLAREAAHLDEGWVHDIVAMASGSDAIVDSQLNDNTFCRVLPVADVLA